MNTLLRTLLAAFLLAMLGNSFALPACSGTVVSSWNNCVGSWADKKGNKYVGDFKSGSYHGQGTYTWPDGRKYVGELKNGKLNGKGIETYANGNKYIGEYKDDKRNGQGTFTFPDGEKYVGQFKDGKYNGQGTLTYAEGGKYVGEFKDDKRDGQGIETNANGAKYVGEWKSGKLDGNGITYTADGGIQESGIFKDDELVTSQYIDPNSFTRIGNNKTAPAVTEVPLLEMERKAAQLEQERIRLAKEREQLNTEKLQRDREDQLKLAQNVPSPVAAQSTKRIALVIGNASYSTRPLKNPRNDADDISRALKTANFDVIDLRDATLSQMRSAVRQFGDKLLNNDVGLVYYSGHGVEVKGKNYFLAVNADIQREDEIADQGLDVALILEKMTTAGKGVNILIVDACRDDPFGRSFRSSSKGLATMDAPRGTIIAYSTSPGKVASDGDPKARNSPYTKALLQAMQVPNRPIEQVFKDVRRSVQAETKDQQTPWENTSLSGDFYFRVQR